MRYEEKDFLALSGVQHFVFCPRQWALIHIEQQWGENSLTAHGDLLHERAHNGEIREKRPGLITARGLKVHSYELGLFGVCDVVEFRAAANGIPLHGEPGLWQPTPVEYKRGKAKAHDADRAQLCAQAMCLEEMLACDIPEAFLYYGGTRSRERVQIGESLRLLTQGAAADMHRLYERGWTPKPRKSPSCRSCSLQNLCIPTLPKRESVDAYLRRHMKEESCDGC